jgi:hypothetical protein
MREDAARVVVGRAGGFGGARKGRALSTIADGAPNSARARIHVAIRLWWIACDCLPYVYRVIK